MSDVEFQAKSSDSNAGCVGSPIATTDRRRMFVKGGKPGPGRPKGRLHGRNRLEHEFIQAVVDDFAKYGKGTIIKVRELDPVAYLKLARSLLPVESKVDVKVGDFSDAHSIEEIFAQVAADLGENAVKVLERALEEIDGKTIDGEATEVEAEPK